ncbi:hypothetical protein ABMA27_010860 [Loxostege sticticalis]|uniref:Uncharacterized protein n=1 Tax=Loxostege sticticalis TaxID=481309 RepID=A0ABR3H371_LOXSC
MYLLLLIFCTCGHISNADDISYDDEGKFIDLLPKEDKDAFIETVARRLFTGVKTKDSRYKSDEEVSDETLNQHSEFVHKVLQEESDNLRRNTKIKRTSEEKMESQGDDKNINPIKIQDDDAKDHIDLTLRSKRSKRHGKTSVDDDNVEFIPVKTVYDDENDRITETKSNIKVNEDGNEDTRNKSKERLGELSAAEDIQVRGHKPHLRESRLAKTEDLNLQESPKDATMIVDFEPEGSQENAKNSNENPDEPTTDSIDHRKTETTTVQEVKISAETTNHVESRYKGTVPIYESQKSDNEGGKSSKESIETDETTTVIIETITTAKNVEETSTKNVEEISTKNVAETSADLAQNTTIKQKYLRDNLDDENLKKEPENRTGEIEKVINNTSEINETKIVRHFDAETSKIDGVIRVLESEVKDNEHFDSLSNDTNLTAENKNSKSSEHDEIINSTKNISNENMSSSPNDSDNKDETVSSPDNTTTTITSTTTTYTIPNNELENQQSLTEFTADESPFVRVKPEPAPEPKEQPYYVPVYNYAPSNAYYNAYNRLGPNDNEEITPTVYERDNSYEHVPPKSLENIFKNFRMPDGHRIFKFNTKKKSGEKFNKKKIIHTSNNLVLPFVVKKPKFTEIYFNPDEYVDMDYYFEKAEKPAFRVRNNQRPRKRTGKSFFPDSDDEDHPYNAMAKKKVNNHINAVRQMMFQQKEFGFGRPSTSTSKPHVNETKEDIHNPTDDENQPEPDEGDFRSHRIPFKPKHLRARDKSDYIILISNDKNRNNNPDRISSNYFFGAYHSDGTTHDRMKREGRESKLFTVLYVNVLQDMVKMENRALEKFDWLGSTVDILGAVRKLKYLTEHMQVRQVLDPVDIQLLNYVLYLFKISKSSLEGSSKEDTTLKNPKELQRGRLPRNKHRKKVYLSKSMLNRLWFNSRHGTPELSSSEKGSEELEFLAFLDDLKNSLHGVSIVENSLHNSLKHIAIVTQYNNQQWFSNLKLLYLKNPEQKVLLEVLLHIFTSRLLELIEKSAKNGLEDGYLVYVEKEEKEVERTKEEFIIVLKLLKEIKNLNN